MTDTEKDEDVLRPFADLIGREFIEFLFDRAPRKVVSRIVKSMDHFVKAQKLGGTDDEMGVIRCIAGEEELVVAIFEWLKLNSDRLPAHGDFIGKYKNHRVKLAFYPVLSQFRSVLSDMIRHGITFPGFEQVLLMKIDPSIDDGRLVLRLASSRPGAADASIPLNPLNISVSREDLDHDEIAEELYRDFEEEVRENNGMSVREFVTARAEFRNLLLYAGDGGHHAMGETLSDLMPMFRRTYRDLLWTLCVLVGNAPSSKEWGLVSQFIDLYRRVLVEAKLV
ncbi:hypothetical protein [Mesorhizobium sp.]|uniref:hypothetical protein n=1 Tax=Mesorhizobium sp. TaxID=1871066 RepID=UPI0025D70D8A|nr:hypothetical protein [Mesorhizobium sp.]